MNLINKKYNKYRKQPNRGYRYNCYLAFEGNKTECQYFSGLKLLICHKVNIRIHRRNVSKSAPMDVLKSLKKVIKENPLKKNDMAWILVDRDCWINSQMKPLQHWAQEHNNYGLAVSNPCFEFWLLLHFEDGKSVNNRSDCTRELKRFCPNYNKDIDWLKYKDKITTAIARAKELDCPPVEDWPRKNGTTVYRLVAKLME